MLFSYNWLQSYFKKRLPKPKKLAELLTMRSFEVEGLTKKRGDWALDIDVLSNRGPDCFSHLGIAREIAAITGFEIKKEKEIYKNLFKTIAEKLTKKPTEKRDNTNGLLNVKVESGNLCSRYTAKVVKDIKVGSSPKYIQNRLEVCGLRSINNIVDATNYIMLETGQPVHAFDFDKLEGRKIIVRKAKKGERMISLENKSYDLGNTTLIIADLKGPLAIAGIKGGKKAEVDSNTRNIILEAANFDMKAVRLTRQELKLQTDSSLRFEHGLDTNLTEMAINKLAFLIKEIAQGKIAEGLIDFYPKKVLPKKVKLDLNYVENLLGIRIPRKETLDILNLLGFRIISQNKSQLVVEAPTFRRDVSIAEDLIEEIGRIYGYDKIPSEPPLAIITSPKKNENIFWESMAQDFLKEAGFSEVYNYSFVGERDAEIFCYNLPELAEMRNFLSSEYKYLRPSLIPNLLKNIKTNLKYFNEIRIFEIGKVFRKKTKAQDSVEEKKMLAGALVMTSGSSEKKRKEFYALKGTVDSLFNKFGISNVWYDEFKPTPQESKLKIWQTGERAEIKAGSQEIGFLGMVDKALLESFNISGKVAVFNIDFGKFQKLAQAEQEYRPISRYPSAVRDLAILVSSKTKVVDVLNEINIAGGALVRDVDVFDIYEGSELPGGRKNFAFHIIYQAEDRTLSSKEIDEIQEKIIKALEKKPEWQVRK